MKPMAKLSTEEMDRLALMFEIAPRLADAYRLKNEFLDVIRSKSSVEGKPKLIDWLGTVEAMDLPEFSDCAKAYRNWFHEILNSMDVPWSNGFIEGCNNKRFYNKSWGQVITWPLHHVKKLSIEKKSFIVKVPPITTKERSLCSTKIIPQNCWTWKT